ncbi:MAG: pyridoxamine 5'-phosphate oxidase family protein [Acidimicrobiia bacterium]|nr:pyridoxamine 5'-phosphate oxidase family protein [Acidimicrobiia bacterium]
MSATPTPGPLQVSSGYGLGDAPADGSALAWSTVVSWLTDARNYWVCSTRPDGRPHAIPVWALWIDGALWFSTDPTSYKARNLAHSPEVVIHLESGDEVCVLEGAARTIGVEDLPAVFVDAYDEKYDIRLDLTDADFGLYVLAPRVALTWTEADFPTTATRWTF